ncbi:MAG: AmpG family muropeptide MFS transporter [Alphaproteobacteria bacterium]
MKRDAARAFLSAFRIYRDRRMVLIAVLGFASGLPLALTFATLSAWLAKEGVGLTTIGLFALVGLPYAFKFAWSPLVDGLRLPGLSRRLGRRRGWMLASQAAVALAIGALGLTDPARAPAVTAALALTVAFLSATQDIVIDAWRIEILAAREQGAGAAAVQLGYRIGMLVSGAGALYIADAFGFTAAYIVMAAVMGVGMAATLLAHEPASPPDRKPAQPSGGAVNWIARHVVAPFTDVLSRRGWLAILLFIVLYKFGDAIAGVMAAPFFIDLGFTLTAIASITKVFGVAATLVGVVMGGVLVARIGIFHALVAGGVLQMLSNLMFAVQAAAGPDTWVLTATIAIENFSGGLGTAAFVAYISRLCSFEFTATQYALFSSLASVGRTVLSSGGGWLAVQLDWTWFFIASAGCALPGLAVLIWLSARDSNARVTQAP